MRNKFTTPANLGLWLGAANIVLNIIRIALSVWHAS